MWGVSEDGKSAIRPHPLNPTLQFKLWEHLLLILKKYLMYRNQNGDALRI